jgi:hypothetical protein
VRWLAVVGGRGEEVAILNANLIVSFAKREQAIRTIVIAATTRAAENPCIRPAWLDKQEKFS